MRILVIYVRHRSIILFTLTFWENWYQFIIFIFTIYQNKLIIFNFKRKCDCYIYFMRLLFIIICSIIYTQITIFIPRGRRMKPFYSFECFHTGLRRKEVSIHSVSCGWWHYRWIQMMWGAGHGSWSWREVRFGNWVYGTPYIVHRYFHGRCMIKATDV